MRVLFVSSLVLLVAACSSGNSSSAAGGGAGASEAGVAGSAGSDAGGGSGGTAGGAGNGGAATAGQGGIAGSDAGTPDAGGDADVDGGNPCGCPAPTFGQWSACSYLDQDCSSTGTRDRSVTYYDCVGGSCQPRVETQSDTTGCARTTEGQPCGSGTINGTWSACQRPAGQSICDPSGTQTRTNTVSVCKSNQCNTSQVQQSQSCNNASTSGCYSITTNTETLKRYGTGGSAATLACPKGYLATGLWSRAGSRDDSMALYCSQMGPDGTLSNEKLTAKVGGTGGSTVVSARCGQGEVMVGIYGKVAPDVITQVGPICAPLGKWVSAHSGQHNGTLSAAQNTGASFTSQCATGVITRLDPTVGSWSCGLLCSATIVRSLQGVCTDVTVAP